MKREDLLDPTLGGNKWRKLKYNLEAAQQQKHHTLLTFGGAWSNHIYATAAAGQRFGFNTIGIIRGEPSTTTPSATLEFANQCGMQLHFIDRNQYREKSSADFIASLKQRYGEFYLLPEGGSNTLALQGCAEIIEEITQDFDSICVACGTGGTLAGLLAGLEHNQHAIGFAVLKGANFLFDSVESLHRAANIKNSAAWTIETDYHFGGYAKAPNELWAFMDRFKHDFEIELDAVYTGKMFYGLFDLIAKGHFTKGTRIIAVHTGGLQGNAGFPH